jgi:hypothetical protein
MTDRIALSLALVLLLLLGADLATGSGAALFLAREFVGLLDLLAVWR